MTNRTVIVELGGYAIKAGTLDQAAFPAINIPAYAKKDNGNGGLLFGEKVRCISEDETHEIIGRDGLLDEDGFAKLMTYICADLLGIPTSDFASVNLFLIVPNSWPQSAHTSLLATSFQKLHVACIYIGRSPLMAAFGVGQPTALVIDIGHRDTEIVAVVESLIVESVAERVELGGRDIDLNFGKLLEEDEIFMGGLSVAERSLFASDPPLFARRLREKGALVDMPKDNAVPLKCVALEEMECKISAATLQHAFDLLVNPSIDRQTLAIQDLAHQIVKRCEADRRNPLLSNLIITGDSIRSSPSLAAAILRQLDAVLAISEYAGDQQPQAPCSRRSIPDYYAQTLQLQGGNGGFDWALAWLGAAIVARIVFADSKSCYTRDDYEQLGSKMLREKLL